MGSNSAGSNSGSVSGTGDAVDFPGCDRWTATARTTGTASGGADVIDSRAGAAKVGLREGVVEAPHPMMRVVEAPHPMVRASPLRRILCL